jgi:hypothetical protein
MALAAFAAALLLAASPAAATPSNDPNYPPDAPTDDYGFVAWCYGALSGQMELYQLVKPDLDALATSDAERADNNKLDDEQMAAGRDYLGLYQRAMEAAEEATPKLNIRGGEAISEGHSIWDKARIADAKTRMWSYLNWDLPGRCETTAHKLLKRGGKE